MVCALNHSEKRFQKDADFVWESRVKIYVVLQNISGFVWRRGPCKFFFFSGFFSSMDERRLDSLE